MYALQKVKDFHLANPNAKRPPKALSTWLKIFADREEDYSRLEDNAEMKDKNARVGRVTNWHS